LPYRGGKKRQGFQKEGGVDAKSLTYLMAGFKKKRGVAVNLPISPKAQEGKERIYREKTKKG